MGALTSKLHRVRRRRRQSQARYNVTEYTEEDKAWLKSAQNSKLLDPLLRVVGVGHRHPRTGRPTVLVCYPLRVAHDPSRADTIGFSKNKWKSRKGTEPVPWPNTFWLVCPEAAGMVGQLEHQGLIQKYHARFVSPAVHVSAAGKSRSGGDGEEEEAAAASAHQAGDREVSNGSDDDDNENDNYNDGGGGGGGNDGGGALAGCSSSSYSPEDAATFARQHEEYGRYRWSLLSPEDAEYAEREGYKGVLKDCGVGGLRFANQVKCLHLHYAHYLASGGDNLVGSWVQAELDRQFHHET